MLIQQHTAQCNYFMGHNFLAKRNLIGPAYNLSRHGHHRKLDGKWPMTAVI